MNKKLLAPLALLFFAFAARAQITTYAYTGQPYEPDNPNAVISGFIELPYPLSPNSTTTITPTIQSFTTTTFSPLSVPGSKFTLTTDSNGNIIAWGFGGELDWACSCATVFSSSDTGDDNVSLIRQPYPDWSYGTSTKPGTWTTITGPPTQALQPQLSTANARIAALNAEVNTLSIQRASYLNGYLYEYALIQRLNAVIVKCRATGGKC